MAAAKLPDELWVNIIEWVPDDVVRRLLGLNRLFSQHALRAKYRSITVNSHLDSHATKRACDRLQHIRDSGYAQYVRCLDIDLTFLSREEPYILPWMAKTFSPVHASVAVTREIRALLLYMAQNAESLTDCCFRWQSGLEFHHQADFLQALWPLLRDSMRNLSLLMTPVYFDTLVQNARNLRALQRLRLDFRFPPSSWVLAEGGIDNFPQFMDSVKGHIRSLDLSWSDYPYTPAIPSVGTPALPHFEHLEELALQVFQPSSLKISEVARFLERHSDQITELDYELRTTEHLTNLFARISFVALTQLSLRTLDLPPQMISLLKTTFFPLDRLEKLAVSGYFMTADEVLIVSSAFTLNPLSHSNSLIQSLHLHVNTITPPFLDTLSSRYPSLKLLSLYYFTLGGSNAPHVTMLGDSLTETLLNNWKVEMAKRKYLNWKVERLVIGHAGAPDFDPEFDQEATKIVARSIPSVRAFVSSLYSQHPSWFR